MYFRVLKFYIVFVTLIEVPVLGTLRARTINRRPIQSQCDLPYLRNGNVKIRQRGKILRFQCNRSFTLIGSNYAGCNDGIWDSPIPYCARSGCLKPEPPEHGVISEIQRGLQVTVHCLGNFRIAGSHIAYCNGTNWDKALGTCRETQTGSMRWCDFEVEDLCGWTNDDEIPDFEWKRQQEQGSTAYKKLRTGPTHDHTRGENAYGHFMLLESRARQSDDVARFLSPVYSPQQSQNACFKLAYHMYGLGVGTLRIYVKPESVDIETMLMDPKYMYFERSGNQKNLWHETNFDLEEIKEPFQIVIEGTSGRRSLSDIAIDDVALLSDDECYGGSEAPAATSEENYGVFDIQSCRDRCNETSSLVTIIPYKIITSGQGKGGYIDNCDCHDECEDLQTCCPDYRNLCAFGTPAFGDETVTTIELNTTPYEVLQTETDFFVTSTKKDIITTTITRNISTTSPRTTSVATTQKTTRKILPTTTTPSTKTTTKSTTLWKTVPTMRIVPPILRRTASTTTKTTTITTSTQRPFPKINSTTSEIPCSTTMKTGTSNGSRRKQEIIRKYSTSKPDIIWHESFDQPTDTDTDPVPSTLALFFECLGGVFIFIVLVGLSLAYYRHNYGPQNYKKNSESHARNGTEEFSEIRYLTSDEQLDFTLQTVVL